MTRAVGHGRGRELERRERRARVAAGAVGEERERVVVGRRAAQLVALDRAAQQHLDVGRGQRLELVDLAARQQRAVDLEVRVLGRRPDERHEPLLDGRQQRVLLGLVEAVDLVEEEDRRLAGGLAPVRRALEHLAHLGAAGLDRRQLLERGARGRGDEPRERRLAGARRPVEDHRVRAALGQRAAQRRALAEQVLLADDLLDRRRAQAHRERRLARRDAGARARRARRRARTAGLPCDQYRHIAIGDRGSGARRGDRRGANEAPLSSHAMKRGRMPLTGAAILLAALLLTSCSGDQGASKGDPVAGKQLFAANGCSGCHTFKAAGSTGTTGPDLDAASPSAAKVMRQLDKPGGLMPSFADKLSADEKRNLAAFVGAGNSSGKAVAAPFRPDSKRLVGLPRRQLRVPRAGVRQPDLQRGPEARARAAADDVDDEHRRRRRLPPDRAPDGLGGAVALQGQGRARVHRRHAGLRVGLLPRHHRARVPRPADEQARRRRAPDVRRLADHGADASCSTSASTASATGS